MKLPLTPKRHFWLIGIYLLIHHVNISQGIALKIRPKSCSNAIGEEGTCMFVWECIKTEGRHLGTCVDGFLFGSCCAHNDTHNSIDFQANSRPTSSPSSSILQASSSPITFKPNINSNKPTFKPHYSSTSKPLVSFRPPSPSSSSSSTVSEQSVSQHQSQSTPSSVAKPWPTASSPIHAQVWPIQSNTPPNVLHTFRPPIFSIFSTYRPPPGSNIYQLRPTFRPPIFNRPTQTPIYQQIYNTRPSISTTSSTTTKSTSTTTTPKPTTPKTTLTNSSIDSSINLISQSIASKPAYAKGSCGVPQMRSQTKVVGGKNAAFGAWPWQVSVRRTSFFGFTSTHRCGGAILNNQWIATAGHCVDDLLLTQIRIRVGEYDFASSIEPYPYIERGAKKKVVHPHYNFFTYENDLALVQLDEPIDFQPHISPICLPAEEIELLGRNATVTGWGRLTEGGVLPSVLQEVKVPIVSNDKCKNMFLTAGRHEYIPEIFMCAGFEEGGRDSCQGDSGGPLQVQGDDGKWFLAGIISWGIGCGEPSLPGVCTRISKFRPWILSNIN